MDYFELEHAIEEWAEEKGIFENGTTRGQAYKTLEEALEMHEAVINNYTKESIIDGIGDIAVTLIIQCKMQNITLEECMEHAYNQIKNRKGKMSNGVFVKES